MECEVECPLWKKAQKRVKEVRSASVLIESSYNFKFKDSIDWS